MFKVNQVVTRNDTGAMVRILEVMNPAEDVRAIYPGGMAFYRVREGDKSAWFGECQLSADAGESDDWKGVQ